MKRPAFVSLKWKLLLPLTLAIAAGTGALTWINDGNLRRAAEQSRLDNAVRSEALLHVLIQQNERQLIDAGAALADFLVASERGELGLASGFALEAYWQQISVNQGLESLRVYNIDETLVAGFGGLPVPDETLTSRVASVLASDQPASGLHCAADCLFYGVVPILRQGATAGAIMVSMDLSALVSTFSRSSGRDLAILIDGDAGSRIYAATKADLAPGLERAAFEPHPRLPRIESALVRNGHSIYKWQKLRPLGTGAGVPYFVTRKDVTADEAAIERAFLTNLVTGLGMFLVAEAVLLVSLAWFMRRMNRVSNGLPLLGEGRWHEARGHLAHREPAVRDELSTLEGAALGLARRLETLDAAARTQQRDLESLVETLSQERDFISGLLDTAQALILTQDMRGTIRMANQYAETVTGLTENQLMGHDFFEQMVAPQERHDWRKRLLAHFNHQRTPLRFEAPLVTPAGLRDITWVHSLIGPDSTGEGLILSVGLDLTELKSAQARATYLSDYDTLTGLFNRQGFQRRLAQALARESRGALLLVDLDDFKAINDLAGHAAGDAVIQHTADRLRGLTPEPRLAARLGGDEFALFYDPVADAELIQIARLLCKGDATQQVATACVGIATARPRCSTESLMGHADLALSQARSKGRSNWHLYNPQDGIRESLLDRTEQLALITGALQDDRLALFLQPIVAVPTGHTAHYEALLRVRAPNGQILAPAPLIAAAEASGLIREIDQWVLGRAVDLIASRPSLRLTVNLSARSLDNPELPAQLGSLLRQRSVDPRQLTLEITETAALNKLTHAEALLNGVRALGCRLALDDFGVGFSTFQYLKHLPVDYVKIDGSFIRTLDSSENDQLFVKAMVEVIHGYGKQAVAEYVENAAILQRVKALGIDYAQGYHFGRPQPAESALGAL